VFVVNTRDTRSRGSLHRVSPPAPLSRTSSISHITFLHTVPKPSAKLLHLESSHVRRLGVIQCTQKNTLANVRLPVQHLLACALSHEPVVVAYTNIIYHPLLFSMAIVCSLCVVSLDLSAATFNTHNLFVTVATPNVQLLTLIIREQTSPITKTGGDNGPRL
jgi:hypothetical protein